jgi:hypothetical protein
MTANLCYTSLWRAFMAAKLTLRRGLFNPMTTLYLKPLLGFCCLLALLGLNTANAEQLRLFRPLHDAPYGGYALQALAPLPAYGPDEATINTSAIGGGDEPGLLLHPNHFPNGNSMAYPVVNEGGLSVKKKH